MIHQVKDTGFRFNKSQPNAGWLFCFFAFSVLFLRNIVLMQIHRNCDQLLISGRNSFTMKLQKKLKSKVPK